MITGWLRSTRYTRLISFPRRAGPADVARLVALAILTQAFKLPPHPRLALEPLLELDLAAANQVEGVTPRLLQVRVHADCLGEVGRVPALGQLEGALVAKGRPSDSNVPALGRLDRINQPGLAPFAERPWHLRLSFGEPCAQ